jgi:hypothetical protein
MPSTKICKHVRLENIRSFVRSAEHCFANKSYRLHDTKCYTFGDKMNTQGNVPTT